MSEVPTARHVALDLICAVLRRKRPLDDAIEESAAMHRLSGRDRAFARLLVATVLRRLGQIDALIADCLNMPLAPRAALVQDILRLGVAQLLFLRTPPHA
ncbi:MAG: MFS transporter, partial [Alphaproteobacteria bacterium]|nr:MFS transporter [Alphaproteobacteria bacterium]